MAIGSSSGSSGNSGAGIRIQNYRRMREPLTPDQQNDKLKNVSQLYEKQFLREMLKAMRGTVSEGGFMPANNAEKIFREQLDQEYVEKWGDRGGIGLADMIHKQLLDRLGPALGIRPMPEKTMGPIKIDQKSLEKNAFVVKTQNDPVKVQRVQFNYDFNSSSKEATTAGTELKQVQSPWSGQLLGSQQINPGEYLLQIKHDNGLKSQIVFRGQLSPDLKPASLSAGDTLGVLHPEAKGLYWSVE